MNLRDAWGFLSFGLVMGLLPVLVPSWFPPTTLDGSSGRAWWLEVMRVVQTGLGGERVRSSRIPVPAKSSVSLTFGCETAVFTLVHTLVAVRRR